MYMYMYVLWHYNIVLWLGSEMPAATHTLINIPLLRYTYIYMACCVRVHVFALKVYKSALYIVCVSGELGNTFYAQ